MEKLISLRFHDVMAITVKEYEYLYKQVVADRLSGNVTVGTQILARLLYDASYRYNELKARQTF
jgi:hypothetical protein